MLNLKRVAACVCMAVLLMVPVAAEDQQGKSAPAATPSLEEQLREQQQRIAALERMVKQQALLLEQVLAQLKAQNSGAAAGEAVAAENAPQAELEVARLSGEVDALAEHSAELQAKLNQMEKNAKESGNKLGERIKGLGNFAFSGDVRLRYEPFFGGTLSQDRHRERVRLRFNAIAKFHEDFTGGLTLSTGDGLDPISTNQTLTGFFQRKFIGIDRAFVQWNPHDFKPLTLTGGKFAYTWYRTELVWDNDLNPEGFSEALSFDFSHPVFKKLTLVGFQLPFRETGDDDDSFVHGGQVGTFWRIGDRVRFAGYASFYNWLRADPVRTAQVVFALSGNSNTNTPAPENRFASNFALLDVIGRFDIDTGFTRWPLMVQLDFVNNTRSCTNVAVAACNPRERSGWWAELQVGQTKEPGDFNFGYTYIRLEREAVLAAFNFSDLRQPTNVVTHRFNANYQAYKNVTLGYTLLVGRALQTSTSPTLEPWLKRMQFDLIYKF